MAKLTRRGLIKRASVGAGATGVLAVAVATGAHFVGASAHPAATSSVNTSGEPVVVIIKDAASGTLVLMRGESQVTVRNPGLVQSLLSL
jgi:hypothetical protein